MSPTQPASQAEALQIVPSLQSKLSRQPLTHPAATQIEPIRHSASFVHLGAVVFPELEGGGGGGGRVPVTQVRASQIICEPVQSVSLKQDPFAGVSRLCSLAGAVVVLDPLEFCSSS